MIAMTVSPRDRLRQNHIRIWRRFAEGAIRHRVSVIPGAFFLDTAVAAIYVNHTDKPASRISSVGEAPWKGQTNCVNQICHVA
jgi:hypothetical protein